MATQVSWGETYHGESGSLMGVGDLSGDQTVVCRQLILATTTYVTGGWTLGMNDTQLSIVRSVKVRLGKDPMGRSIANTGITPVVTIVGDKPKLQFYRRNDAGAIVEFANATLLGAASTYIWLEFIGVQ